MAKNVYEGGYAGERVVSSTLGRWPANTVTDGSDEVVSAFPNSNGSGNARTLKRGKRSDSGWGMQDAPGDLRDAGSGSAARFFYSGKATKEDRAGSRHPTVKRVSLLQYLAKLITPHGGTILDPFAGSGTMATACHREGFDCILIERESEYIDDIKRRIAGLNPLEFGRGDAVKQTKRPAQRDNYVASADLFSIQD